MHEMTVSDIKNLIVNLPGRPPAMLSKDLAGVYEVTTSALNQAVKRNEDRFPDDFMFQTTNKESDILRSHSVMSQKAQTATPYLFTQMGANQLCSVLHSDIAVKRSIQIMRAFTEMEQGKVEKPKELSRIEMARKLLESEIDREEAEQARLAMEKKVGTLSIKIEADKPKVLFAESVTAAKADILVGELAKLLKQNGFEIGQNRLFERLRIEGYLMKVGESKNLPTQRSMAMGLFRIKKTTINNPDGSIRVTRTTKVTGKGAIYFINKYLGNKKVAA